jgi:signal peptidase I
MTDEELEKSLQHFDNSWMDNSSTPTFQKPDANLFSEIDKILSEEAGITSPDFSNASFSKPQQPTPRFDAQPKPIREPKPEPVVAPKQESKPLQQPAPHKSEPKPIVPEPRKDFYSSERIRERKPVQYIEQPEKKEPEKIDFEKVSAKTEDAPISFKPAKSLIKDNTLSFDDENEDAPIIIREDNLDQPGPISKVFRTTCSIIICLLIAVCISFLITRFVAHHTTVDGSSMSPTLHNSDQIIVENVSYYLHDPQRFDVVVFPYSKGVYYIKRVIGLPKETVQIKDGRVYINGQVLRDDTYCKDKILDAGLAQNPIKLGYDEYFVLGDNRNVSVDSRKESVGVIHKGEITGKAWWRFYPFGDIGCVK